MRLREAERLVADLGAANHGVVIGSELRSRGVSQDAIRNLQSRGLLERLRRDIFHLRDHPWTWEAHLQALLFDAGPKAVVSHRSAGRLHRLWRYRSTDVVEVTGPELHDHRIGLGRLHRCCLVLPEHRTVVGGFPVTTVARTCFDLMGDPDPPLRRTQVGREVHAKNMGRVVNDALARHGVTIGQLVAVRVALAKRGRPGSTLARQIVGALSESYVPTESEGEDLFVELLDVYDLPQPKRQVAISGEQGWIARVDFLFEEVRLVVEIDGRTHEGPLDREADRRRDREIEALGYTVWRIPYLQLVRKPEQVLRELRRRLPPSNSGSLWGL